MGTRLDPTRRTVEGLTAPAVRLLHLSRTRVRCSAKWLESTPVGVLWSRMLEVEFVDRSVALAAKLFVSFFPLLVIAAALARDTVRETMVAAVMDRLGVSGGALDLVQQAFATPEATRAATGAVGVLLTVAFAVSFTTALQRAYLRAWRRPSGGGLRNKGRGALWVGGALVYLMTLAFASKLIGGDIGAVGAWLAGVAVGTLLWWWSAWLMLRGEVRWRPLFPSALFTAAGISLYAVVADVWMPLTVTDNFRQFGAFGVALSFVTFFTGMAFVVVTGAVLGPVLAEADDPLGRWLRHGATTPLMPTAAPPLPGPQRPMRLSDAFGGDSPGTITSPGPHAADPGSLRASSRPPPGDRPRQLLLDVGSRGRQARRPHPTQRHPRWRRSHRPRGTARGGRRPRRPRALSRAAGTPPPGSGHRTEHGQHGEHPAVVVGRGGQVELEEDRPHMGLDGRLRQEQRLADRAVRAALGHQGEHVPFAGGQAVEADDRPGRPAQQAGDDGRVDHAFAVHQPA